MTMSWWRSPPSIFDCASGCSRSMSASGRATVERHRGGTAVKALLQRVTSARVDVAGEAIAAEIGRAHVELQSRGHLVCRLLLEKKKHNQEYTGKGKRSERA